MSDPSPSPLLTTPDRAPSESLLVFSDVHLGCDLDDRHGHVLHRTQSVDGDLVALLEHYRGVPPTGDRWRIVIAGDFIDFIGMTVGPDDAKDEASDASLNDEEMEHGLGSSAEHARQKLRRVALRHADVFRALAVFVADGHALTLVHGNHDAEFHWDEVKDCFREALRVHAEGYGEGFDAAAFDARIEFNPWFFWREGVVFIEHGHQYDAFCSTPYVMAPLYPVDPRRMARGFCDVLLRFVVRPTRGLRETGHEQAGIVHYLSFGAALGVRGMFALVARVGRALRELFAVRRAALSSAARSIRSEHERRVERLAAVSRLGAERLRAVLALQVAPVTSSVRGILASLLLDRIGLAVVAAGLTLAAALLDTVAPLWRGGAVLSTLALWLVADRLLARHRQVDAGERLTERAGHLARLFPAAFVVMGHTHAPSVARSGETTYINVGSWSEVEDDTERAPRTHLVIHVTAGGVEGHFRTWSAAGPEPVPEVPGSVPASTLADVTPS